MHNTSMEDWGKQDQFPRYRWERPDVMDRDCAVSVEYARDVLAGRRGHKWSKLGMEGVGRDDVGMSEDVRMNESEVETVHKIVGEVVDQVMNEVVMELVVRQDDCGMI